MASTDAGYSKGAKHPVPAGGLFSTGDDLAKLYQCLLNKALLNGKRILGEKALADIYLRCSHQKAARDTPSALRATWCDRTSLCLPARQTRIRARLLHRQQPASR